MKRVKGCRGCEEGMLGHIVGTEKMRTFPHHDYERVAYGLHHYGAIKYQGQPVFKIASYNVEQLKGIGWKLVKQPNLQGNYAYMARPVATPHTCPYREDVEGDTEFLCYCDEATMAEEARDI